MAHLGSGSVLKGWEEFLVTLEKDLVMRIVGGSVYGRRVFSSKE